MDEVTSELWEEFAESGDPSTLVEHYTQFARQVAISRYNKLPSFVSFDDIEASALVGLWMAIERFDPTLGVPVESFARQRIQGNILDDIREEDHSSRTTRDLQKSINKVNKKYQTEFKRPPTVLELAKELEVTEEEALKLKRKVREAGLVSLDASLGPGDDGISHVDIVTGTEDDTIVYPQELFSKVLKAFTKRERLLFALIYFEGLTLHQAAPIMGLTHPMTCQMNFRLSDELERCYKRAVK